MKKFISLFLAIVMLAMLVGCNNVPSGSGDNKGDTPKAELSRGTIDGDVYTNEYLGFNFTKPESWVYSTDEEIAAALNVAVDTTLGENFKDALENNPSTYDMMVVDTLTRTNINVAYENLTKTFSSNITEKQYVEALKQQLSSVSGMTVTFPDEYETAKLGDGEYTKVVCSANAYGASMTQVYYLRKIDKYMAMVIATVPTGYTVDEIEAMFE